jgi:hypothetical protein
MLKQYEQEIAQVGELARALGFKEALNENFLVRFSRWDGWRLTLEGDRNSSECTIWISKRGIFGTYEYAVWIMMRAFHDWLPADRRVPSTPNQLWFVRRYRGLIFAPGPPWYHGRVERENAIKLFPSAP